MGKRDQAYLRKRVRDETRAALRASDPHVAAVHVQLAQRYVQTLNEVSSAARA
ncbi:MAG TPA: hypothetical protein VGR19_10325 [Allosphingosinicella sp.]|nr:hypothetical protein [Allosphingosinicella sp.]